MGKYRILLTGITGFIGSHLAEKLLEENYEVHAIVRPSSKIDRLLQRIARDVHFHVLTDGAGNMADIVGESRPDLVYHLASLYLSNHGYGDIPQLLESNITFGTQLLEAMRIQGIHRFINTGTSWQHYQDNDYEPVNLYAASKQAFLDILYYYEKITNLQVINLQLFDTYGSGDKRRKVMDLLKNNASGQEPLQMSPGDQYLDLLHVDDVVRAFLLAGKYLLDGKYGYCGTYAVSSGRLITLRDLANLYESVTNQKLHIIWGGRPYRAREVMVPWQKGQRLPGFFPQITLEEGIRRLTREQES